jgi:integrase
MKTPQAAKTTLQKLSRIAAVHGLYRHENGTYYGKKKINGTRKVAALTTANGENISDRKLAETALEKWKAELTAPKPATMLFADLWAKWEAAYAGMSDGTKSQIAWVKQCFEVGFPQIFQMEVSEIKPSHLVKFFGLRSKKLGCYSFNELSRQVKGVFAIAVADELIKKSPWEDVPKNFRRKPIKREEASIPTIEQCQAIVLHVRNQTFADTAEASADMLEFMHKAALGTAECENADWSKVNWNGNYIEVKRIKTGAYFRVPIYPHLKTFLIGMHERQGKPKTGKIFSIKSPKQALYNACKRLGFDSYSPIDFRKSRIKDMIRKGVPAETIAKWQGHKDNGILIRRTYMRTFDEQENAFEREQLTKLAG